MNDERLDGRVGVRTRREVLLMSAAGVAAAAARPLGAGESLPRFAYVGSFKTSTRGAHGEGLSVYAVDAVTGRWTRVQLLSDVINPGYLALHPRLRVLYAVQPVENVVSAFAIDDKTGHLSPLNRQPSGGDDPSHLAVDPSGRFVVTANYVGGTVGLLPVKDDGSLVAPSDVVTMKGELGPHRTEQPGPHPHQCPFAPSGRFLVVSDKGLDRLFVFTIDASKGALVPANPPFATTRSGAGPRHLAFHPRLAYAWVVNELDCTVTAYRYTETGAFAPIQILPTLPATYTGNNTGAAIVVAPSGRFVYTSNRGHESVAIFRVDEATGMLTSVGWEPSQGTTPRFVGLNPSGSRLFAANQRSDTIVEYAVNQATGALAATGQVVKASTPVCIVFV
jgi:6-phosphogluconolactonase